MYPEFIYACIYIHSVYDSVHIKSSRCVCANMHRGLGVQEIDFHKSINKVAANLIPCERGREGGVPQID
jgi:hypothetical protein